MQIVINLDEDVRIAITRMGLLRIPDEMQKRVDKAIQHGTSIPDNATNGDVMEMIFPKIGVYDEWYDEPYQKGGK